MTQVYLGLGSNLGEPVKAIEQALELIEKTGLARVKRVSCLYETEPVGIKDQPWFINAVALVETERDPLAFRRGLEEIEQRLGRPSQRVKNGPRIIDLDILLWGELVFESEELVIPHPRMHLRRFVLEPLAELDPDLLHPSRGKTIKELLEELRDPSLVRRCLGPPCPSPGASKQAGFDRQAKEEEDKRLE